MQVIILILCLVFLKLKSLSYLKHNYHNKSSLCLSAPKIMTPLFIEYKKSEKSTKEIEKKPKRNY